MNPIHDTLDLARAERETLRWVLLTALWYARPYGAIEHVLMLAANDAGLRSTSVEVRNELDWLSRHGLIEIARSGLWQAELTAQGMAVYEYRAEAPAGLARPPRW